MLSAFVGVLVAVTTATETRLNDVWVVEMVQKLRGSVTILDDISHHFSRSLEADCRALAFWPRPQ